MRSPCAWRVSDRTELLGAWPRKKNARTDHQSRRPPTPPYRKQRRLTGSYRHNTTSIKRGVQFPVLKQLRADDLAVVEFASSA